MTGCGDHEDSNVTQIGLRLRNNIMVWIFLDDAFEDFFGLVRFHHTVVKDLSRAKVGFGHQGIVWIGFYKAIVRSDGRLGFPSFVQPPANFKQRCSPGHKLIV